MIRCNSWLALAAVLFRIGRFSISSRGVSLHLFGFTVPLRQSRVRTAAQLARESSG